MAIEGEGSTFLATIPVGVNVDSHGQVASVQNIGIPLDVVPHGDHDHVFVGPPVMFDTPVPGSEGKSFAMSAPWAKDPFEGITPDYSYLGIPPKDPGLN